MEKAQMCMTDEWIMKKWYLYNGILLSHKKNGILLFAMTWMELESIMLGKISQPEREKYHMI